MTGNASTSAQEAAERAGQLRAFGITEAAGEDRQQHQDIALR
jgi:hypothetical protein